MDERYIASVDLGSSKIAVSVAEINGSDVQIVYYRETPSEGVRNSVVFNPAKTSECVRQSLLQAESELGIKILQVVVGLPRYHVEQESACASMERSDKESSITEEEINFLKTEASETYPMRDKEREQIYGIIAQSFSTDDFFQAGENDIVGMVSETLEGNFKVFLGKKRACANIDKVMNSVGKAIAGKYFIPEMTAKAVLTAEERENGVALIEIGAGVTSVTIYRNNILCHYSSIPFGGKTVTGDIRIECGTSDRLAENIKLAYGVCMPDRLVSLRDKIIQIENSEDGSCKQMSVKYLSEIITCRMEEIIKACLYIIQESGYADNLGSGIVLTGGGAMLPNLSIFTKELSGYNVRIGFPLHKFSYTGCSEVCDTTAAASIGMILAAKENPRINCLSERIPAPVTEKFDETGNDEADGNTSETPADITTEETIVKDDNAGIGEAKTEASPHKDGKLFDTDEYISTDAPKKKEKKKKRPKITWVSNLMKKVQEGVENTIDGLYDDMNE